MSLKVFDVMGRKVATLVDGVETAGLHTVTWNASKFASGVSAEGGYASGVYFYRLMSTSSKGTFADTKRMVLIK